MAAYINILIVDDDNDDASFLVEGLSGIISNFKIYNAYNGEECLQFLMNNDLPQIIFMVLNMPKKNGIETLKAFRNDRLCEKTNVIIYSTSGNSRDIDACFELGDRFYLVKPLSFTGIKGMLQQLFKKLDQPLEESSNKYYFVIRDSNTNYRV